MTPAPGVRISPWIPWGVRILVICLLLGAAIWAARTIRLETELLALLPQELPSVRGLDGFSRWFSSDREVVLVADDSMPVLQRQDALRRLKPALAALPGVASVQEPYEGWRQHAPQLAAWMAWNLPPDQFRKITESLRPDTLRKRLAALPDRLAGALDVNDLARLQMDPLGLLSALVEDEPRHMLFQQKSQPPLWLTITSTKPLLRFQDCADFSDAVKRAVAETLPGETRLLLTGRPAFTAEISTQMRHDMLLMVVVAAALAAAAFWTVYRSLKPLIWILLGQFLALGVALLGARLSVGSLNVISMGFGCILLGISMDYSILVYHHYATPFRDDHAVWRRLRRGIWFSAVTTAAAFLVLGFASLPGLRQLGSLVAGGLLASAWFATWLLPAVWRRNPPKTQPFLQRAGDRLAAAMERGGGALLGLASLTAVAAGWAVARAPEDFYSPDLARLQPVDSAAFRGQVLLAKQDPEESDALYLVRAGNWDAVRDAADELARRFAQTRMAPLSALIPAPARQAENRVLWPAGVVKRLREAFADAGFGEEWSASTLAFCDTLTRAASGDASAFAPVEPMLARLLHSDTAAYLAVVRIRGVADSPVPPAGLSIPGVEVMPVSWVALKADLDATARGDLRRLGGGALAVLVLLCALAQRSLRLVLLNLAGLALSLLLLAALLALTGTLLGVLSLLCVPLLLGLVIDYSLHVLMAIEHERGDFRRLYGHIGLPILLTGVASCIGFGAPMLTNQPALRNFGLVMDLGIISAVFACLFLLPVLARLTSRPVFHSPVDRGLR